MKTVWKPIHLFWIGRGTVWIWQEEVMNFDITVTRQNQMTLLTDLQDKYQGHRYHCKDAIVVTTRMQSHWFKTCFP